MLDLLRNDACARLAPSIGANAVDLPGRQPSWQAEADAPNILKNAPIGIYQATVDRLISANSTLVKMFGYETLEDMVASASSLRQHFVKPEQWSWIVGEAKRSETGVQQEAGCRRTDGSVFTARVRMRAVRNEAGQVKFLEGFVEDLSERKNLEGALALREQLLNSFFTTATAGLCIVDADLRCVQINEILAGINGLPVSQHLGRSIRSILPHLAPALEPFLRQVLATGKPVLNQHICGETLDESGRTRHWMVSSFPIPDKKGKTQSVGCVVVDITEQKRVEERLRVSEQNYRNLFESSRDAMMTLDPATGRLVSGNPAALKLFGSKNEEEFLAFTPMALSPERQPDGSISADKAWEMIGIAMLEGSHFFEWTHRRTNGEEFSANVLLTRIAQDEKAGIQVTVRDITEQKLAERRILEARNYSQTLLAASPIGIITYQASGEAVSANAAAARLIGTTVENLKKQNFRRLDSWKKSNLLRLAEAALETGQEQLCEDHIVSSYGMGLWLSCRFVPFLHEGRQHLMFLAQDIFERKQLEERLRQAQKMEAIGQLAGGMAHDFNNILSATLMHLGLLHQNPELTMGTQAILKEVEGETMRAAGLTRQLLLFSRRQIAKVETLDLNCLIRELLRMLGRLLGENIEIVFQASPESTWVCGDAGMMEQVVMNLCINARDAMAKGGRLTLATSRVELGVQPAKTNPGARPGSFVRLTVTDTGCGMSKAVLNRIFEPFFTTKEVGRGTGLGLATVYGIVEQHKGWVDVESAVGQGSSFRVYLPAAAMRQPTPPSSNDSGEIIGGSETILLVEDDLAVRRPAALCLRQLGYAVLEASNGQDALKLWAQHRSKIGLLLTDMVMPGAITGMDLIRQMKAEQAALRIIISSGYTADLCGTPLTSGQDVAYLDKPYQAAVLARTVRCTLDKG